MLLNQTRPASELQYFVIAEHESTTLGFDHFASSRAAPIESIHHLYFFATEPAAYDWSGSRLQRRLKHDPFIWRGHALHNCFAQTPGAVASVGVERRDDDAPLITTTSRNPDSVSSVNITPEQAWSERTMG